MLLAVIFVDADAIIWFKHWRDDFILCVPWRLKRKGEKKPEPFWKEKHLIIKYTFPESGRADVLSPSRSGRVWRLRGLVPRAHFIILKSQGVWGKSLNMGGLVWVNSYLYSNAKGNLPHFLAIIYYWIFFSKFSRCERLLSQQINSVFEIEGKKHPFSLG